MNTLLHRLNAMLRRSNPAVKTGGANEFTTSPPAEFAAPPSITEQSLRTALTRPDPVLVEERPGDAEDRMDKLVLIKDIEGNDPYSDAVWSRMETDAKVVPEIAKMFEVYNLWDTPAERFERIHDLGVVQAIAELMSRFGIGRSASIADVGCGWGWLPFSLDRLGYTNLVAMDPSENAVKHLRINPALKYTRLHTEYACRKSIS